MRASDKCLEGDAIDVNEMVVLAASLDDCEELEPADIIWAKLTGICPRVLHHILLYPVTHLICTVGSFSINLSFVISIL